MSENMKEIKFSELMDGEVFTDIFHKYLYCKENKSQTENCYNIHLMKYDYLLDFETVYVFDR